MEQEAIMARRYRVVQVDVFTDQAFGGNQLAVFTDARGLTTGEMQILAREMAYSESTFVLPADHAGAAARVRIFTPTTELPLAGHPTVGTSFVLARDSAIPLDGEATEAILELGVGPVPVVIERRDGRPSFVWMTQPAPVFGPVRADRDRVAAALGVSVADLHGDWPLQVVSTGVPFLYVPLRSLAAVAACRPDAAALSALFADSDPASLLVFALETVTRDATVHARMFAPHTMGIPEDPATGAAAGPLGAYLARYGALPAGPQTRFVVEQGLEMGRPSHIHVEVRRRGEELIGPRVGGQAVIVGEGDLFWD